VPTLDLRFADNKSLTDAVTGASLVTFTRASSGTYVDSAGVIRTAVTNLLLQSEDFSTTWTGSATVTPNTANSPFGELSADTLTYNAVSASRYQNLTTAPSTTYTFSVWMRAVTGTFELKLSRTNTASWAGATVSDPITLTTEWQRYSLTFTTGASDIASGLIIGDEAQSAYNLPATGSIYAWGAQLEESSTVGEYIPTTSTINSAPRFDHNPTTGESLGLLVEESRTNLLLRSEEFDDIYWSLTNSTVSPNEIASPAGTVTAEKQTHTEAGPRITRFNVATFAASSQFTFSFFAKAGTSSYAAVSIYDGTTAGKRFWFNITTGVPGSITNIGGGYPSATSQMEAFANGWYRCICTITNGSNTTVNIDGISVCLDTNGSLTPSVSGVYGYIWGAQLEAGSFPTSYIPTTTAAATRSADLASIGGTAFSGWYRQDEGTVFSSYQIPAGSAVNTNSRQLFDSTDGTTNNRFSVRGIGLASTADQITVRSGASTVAQFSTNGIAVGTTPRAIAAAYRLNDYAAAATGSTSAVADTSGALPVGINQVSIGGAVNGTEYLSGAIRRLAYWPARLPNSTIQSITQ